MSTTPIRTAPPARTASTAGRGMTRDEVARLGLPLGPRSLTWRYFGDLRGFLLAERAGVLQNMHPVISQTLVDHSDFFANPMDRIRRSGPPILGVVYDHVERGTGPHVRDLHKGIKGTDLEGRGYRALDPEAFYWAHATFFEGQLATQRLLGTALSDDAEERLYRESITWYARYGVSLRPVPRDYAAFRSYWDEMLDHVLEATPVALFGVRRVPHQPPPIPEIPGIVWTGLRPAAVRLGPWLGRVTLPRRARETLGVRRSFVDEAALGALRTAVRATWPAVPHALRRQPRALAADRREGVRF
ncbi:oxygenase MpaB family protein [Patulibacter sp.]|uniref:oxygenase MpaB family protein n=1 Tax=Patulibacter sp. TaxID=1912859 RepID=UPI00271CAEDE|nr:oxygenase MpaB family protein [Patulibacter sp.]MDO9408115.1 oxygenase MpaB family protein [Patulibacter sp.]